jgi:serine/threonine protein kinase
MAVLNAQYKHPTSSYSPGLKALIDSMLKINPQERPDIQQVTLSPWPAHVFDTHVTFRYLTQRSACSNLHDSERYPILWLSILLSFSRIFS